MTVNIFELKKLTPSTVSTFPIYYYVGQLNHDSETSSSFTESHLRALQQSYGFDDIEQLIGLTFVADDRYGGPVVAFRRLVQKAMNGLVVNDELLWQVYHQMIYGLTQEELNFNFTRFDSSLIVKAVEQLLSDDEDEWLWFKFIYLLSQYTEGNVHLSLNKHQPTNRADCMWCILTSNCKSQLIEISVDQPYVSIIY